MDPKVELAVKLSFMQGMLEAMSNFDDMDVIHHDNKPGNYFMHSNGDIVGADFGTASKGPTSENILAVDNPEQQSPESCTHRFKTDNGPPYGQVGTKSDCFAFGVAYVNFVFGNDMFSKDNFQFNTEKEVALAALYEHRDGFFLPPEPQLPNPAVDPALAQYNSDLKEYNRMKEQQKFLELAGFTIHDDGRILMFPEDGNPLHTLGNNLLSGDPAKRASAKDARNSQAMLALRDPVTQDALKEMRSIMGSIDTEKTVKLKTGANQEVDTGLYAISPQQQKRLEELSKLVQAQIGSQEVWDDMLGG
jgi:serine/threonine protein kinase